MIAVLERTCEGCRGYGVLESEEWADYWRARQAHAQQADVDRLGVPEPGGPEEVPCGVCDGTGLIPTAEGRAVLELVRRHLLQPGEVRA